MHFQKRGFKYFHYKNVNMEGFVKDRPMEETMPTERCLSHLSTRKCLSTDRDFEKTPLSKVQRTNDYVVLSPNLSIFHQTPPHKAQEILWEREGEVCKLQGNRMSSVRLCLFKLSRKLQQHGGLNKT